MIEKGKITCKPTVAGGYKVFITLSNGATIELGFVRKDGKIWRVARDRKELPSLASTRQEAIGILRHHWTLTRGAL
jgi:hypothetical protein